MGSYRVVSGQNIYDVALHLYGSIEGIVDLLMCNPALTLDTVLKVGEELMYTDDFVIDADVVAYNRQHGVIPANGERQYILKSSRSLLPYSCSCRLQFPKYSAVSPERVFWR